MYSVLWGTFGSDYSLKSSWVWCYKLATPVFGEFVPFFPTDALKLCQVGWGALVHSYFQVQSPEMFNRFQVWALAGHSRTFTILSGSHSCIFLAVCFGSLSCWKVNLHPSLRSWVLCSRSLSSEISRYFARFIFPSILTHLPVPVTEKHLHSMRLPPPCFTVEMVLARWWAVPGFLPTWHLAFRPKSSILFLMVCESFRCLFANSKRAAMCRLLRSGFCLATLP